MGRALIGDLLGKGHHVCALARRGSENKLPAGVEIVTGDGLDAGTYRQRVIGADTFVHLVGVAHPSPAKADQFRSVIWSRSAPQWPPDSSRASATSSTSVWHVPRR